MISKETVWQDIWPVVESAIQATLAEDGAGVKRLLVPNTQIAAIYMLFGVHVFDILLKTVLGRGHIAPTRAIETENGKAVHIEYVWPDPEAAKNSYTAADVVAVRLRKYKQAWRIYEINPASADLPLTEARAKGILVTSQTLSQSDGVPQEPWILPIALYGGNLQIPLRKQGMRDGVERLLLPGLQHRTFGIISIVSGRRLWRDFKKKAKPHMGDPAGWAAAVEYIMGEQTLRETNQAAVAKSYNLPLTAILPCIKHITQTLQIEGLDERYTPLHSTQIVFNDPTSS